MPNFFDGQAIVARSKQPANYRQLNRKFRTRDGLYLTQRILALLGQDVFTTPGTVDVSFVRVQGQTPVPVDWNTNAHRLYGGIVPVETKTIEDRDATIFDMYDIQSLVADNALPPIKSYADAIEATDGVRFDEEDNTLSVGHLLGINFRLGVSRLGD